MRTYIIIGLLLLLPQAMLGQAYLPKYETKGWWPFLYKGGMIRTKEEHARVGKYYMVLPEGLSGWFNGNYVDGFHFGPELTLGIINDDHSRWETDLDLKYTVERKEIMSRFAVRHLFAPEYHGNVSFFAQHYTEDFDPDPMMGVGFRSSATSIFGWNSYKLFLKTAFGAKGSVALWDNLQMSASLWWEEREQMRNHRKRNAFRAMGESNYPRMRGLDPERLEEYQLLNWQKDQLMRLDVQFDYAPGRWILVKDDMHSETLSRQPVFSLKASAGYNGDWSGCADYGTLQEDADPNTLVKWQSGLRYLSLELSVTQSRDDEKYRWQYCGAAGGFVIRNNIGLADMRHFDATHFLWQEVCRLTWFSLLTNYELSTSRQWAELHGEYLRKHNSFFGQYIQGHYLSVADCRPHLELSYGWQLPQNLRFGLTAGWDGSEFDGLGFNLVLPME